MLSDVNIAELDLPIKKTRIDGPMVKALSSRKEDNNNVQVSVEVFKGAYASVKDELLADLQEFASTRVKI